MTPHLSEAELLEALHREFDRLNEAHLSGKLARPEIVLSRRKSFGGYYQPRLHRIVLSWQAYREYGWPEVLNTFRHEVAHAVHPNHSKSFWELARRLGSAQRYASEPLRPRVTPKYLYECPGCKRILQRCRRLKQASCGTCDRRYNPRFALRLVSGLG